MRKTLLLISLILWGITAIQAQSAEEINKTLPTPKSSANYDWYGQSVAIEGNYAVVGAPGNHGGKGMANMLYYDGTKWDTIATLTASDGVFHDNFGSSVSISNHTIAIGAFGYHSDNLTGKAYVFEKPATGWIDATETAILSASDGGSIDYFGRSISISNNTIIVGAPGNEIGNGAAYIFEKPATGWENMTETAKLKASNEKPSRDLGRSVDISGNTIIVGAYSSSSAYVFEKPATGWVDTTETAKLTASDGKSSDAFGHSVSISNNTIVVGAYGNNSYMGAAYVFEKPSTGWVDTTETAKLTAYNGEKPDNFGYSANISGNTIVVGALFADSKKGAAYVFEKPATGWKTATETAKLTASNATERSYFGISADVSNNTIMVGAYWVNGTGTQSGSVYVFEKPAEGWINITETSQFFPGKYMNASNARYGNAVSIDGHYAVVGSPRYEERTGTAYVLHYNGTKWETLAQLSPSDGLPLYFFAESVSISGNTVVIGAQRSESTRGAVYVFEKPVSGWLSATETAKLTASDGESGDYFGNSVSVSGNTIVVGAEDKRSNTGLAYVFEKPVNGWKNSTETAVLSASDSARSDDFGSSVSISKNTIVIGARGDDSNKGAAYVFEKPETGWKNITETAKLTASGGEEYDEFGLSVSVSNNAIVVGIDKSTLKSAYVFEKPESGWKSTTETAKLTASDVESGDYFGRSVDVSGNTIVVGAFRNGSRKGSAYVFQKPATGWKDFTAPVKLVASDGTKDDEFGRAVGISGNNIIIGADYKNNEYGFYAGATYFYKYTLPTSTINNHDDQKLVVYPNPTKGTLNIASEKGEIQQVEILSLTGKTVYVNTDLNETKPVDISTLPNGIYLLKIQVNNSVVISKIIKE